MANETSTTTFQAEVQEQPTIPTCRSKLGVFPQETFNYHACSWCYYYLFKGKDLPLFPDPFQTLTVIVNGTRFKLGTTLIPDAENITTQNAVCSTLSEDDCQRWQLCCAAGKRCCTRQLHAQTHVTSGNTSCGPTWDGFGCWDSGEPGKNSYISCPTFLRFSVPTSKSELF